MDPSEKSGTASETNGLAKGAAISFLLGLPFHQVTLAETVDACVDAIEAGTPRYFVDAHADFVVQAYENDVLRDILFHADLSVCGSSSLLWLSRLFKPALPERVGCGALIDGLFRAGALRSWRVYLMGGTEATFELTRKLAAKKYPGLTICGHFSPSNGPIDVWPNSAIVDRIRAAHPHLILVAVGCPKQEFWISRFHQKTGVPLSIGVGSALDFLVGQKTPAPGWMQRSGMEWLWRIFLDPNRMVPRYSRDLYHLIKLSRTQWRLTSRGKIGKGTEKKSKTTMAGLAAPVSVPSSVPASSPVSHGSVAVAPVEVEVEAALSLCVWPDRAERSSLEALPVPAHYRKPVVLDLSEVSFIDSCAIGRLVHVARQCRQNEQKFALLNPSEIVCQLINDLHLGPQFPICRNLEEMEAR